MMDRRGFLMAAAAAFTIDPDRLLWRPGEKHFSIPKPTARLLGFDYYEIEWPVKTSRDFYVFAPPGTTDWLERELFCGYHGLFWPKRS